MKKQKTLKKHYAKKATLLRGNPKSCRTRKYQAVYGRGRGFAESSIVHHY